MKVKDKQRKMEVMGEKHEKSEIKKFRDAWLKKGYELVDITSLVEFKLGISGNCNDFNEPDDQIYHIQVYYRDEWICSFPASDNVEEGYVVFMTNHDDIVGPDFILFKKCKYEEEKK